MTKAGTSVAEIHTQHLLDNLSYLRPFVLNQGGEFLQMAVIKADAYGHGRAVATARVIADAVDWNWRIPGA